MLKQVITLYLITIFAGGLINSIYYYTNIREQIIKLGDALIFSNHSFLMVIIIILCLIPATYLILWLRRINQSEKKETYEIELYYGNNNIHSIGLMDSGNCLYDPIFRKPVMVIENSLIKSLLPEEVYHELEAARKLMEGKEGNFVPSDVGSEHVLHLRFIPYQSIGKANGMMIGLILDRVIIHTGKETISNEKVTAAICDNHLSTKDDYHALLHREHIQDEL